MAAKTQDYVPLNDAADAASMAVHAARVSTQPINAPKIDRVEISRVANGFVVRLEPDHLWRHPGTINDDKCHVFTNSDDLGTFLAARLK